MNPPLVTRADASNMHKMHLQRYKTPSVPKILLQHMHAHTQESFSLSILGKLDNVNWVTSLSARESVACDDPVTNRPERRGVGVGAAVGGKKTDKSRLVECWGWIGGCHGNGGGSKAAIGVGGAAGSL